YGILHRLRRRDGQHFSPDLVRHYGCRTWWSRRQIICWGDRRRRGGLRDGWPRDRRRSNRGKHRLRRADSSRTLAIHHLLEFRYLPQVVLCVLVVLLQDLLGFDFCQLLDRDVALEPRENAGALLLHI